MSLSMFDDDPALVTAALVEASEAERLAFGREVAARFKAIRPEDWWEGKHDPTAALGLLVLGTMPSAARAATLLNRHDMREKWGHIPSEQALAVLRARDLPWLGDLGTRLAEKLFPPAAWNGSWSFVATLLTEAGATPPATENVVRAWLNFIRADNLRVPLVDRLREDPFVDVMLPALFELDGLGAELNAPSWDIEAGHWAEVPAFPGAVAQLVAEGRLDRKPVLDATVDRLARGDRPAWLRPFALLHDDLKPTVDELAAHVPDYARLLPDAPSTVAAMAQRALRTLDDAGRLELPTLLQASHPTLTRKEKVLVKAQLTWLDRVARREPDRAAEVLETVTAAFDHPSLEIQERALTLIARHAAALTPAQAATLARAASSRGGNLPSRAAEVFAAFAPTVEVGRGASGTGVPASPASAEVAVMPGPIADAAELAEEVSALVHDPTAARWERVLAGLVALRPGDDTSALRSLLDRLGAAFGENSWPPRPHLVALGVTIGTLIDGLDPGTQAGRRWQHLVEAVRARQPGASHPELGGVPDRLLTLRLIEMSLCQPTTPVPLLLATPTHVNGSLDPAALVERLRRAEAEGWQPWPLDFEQALLRLPRDTDPAVADGLTDRRLADWLAAGGLPDPVSTRFDQQSGGTWAGPPEAGRVVANLAPTRPATLSVEDQLLTVTRHATKNHHEVDPIINTSVLAATLPHHREVIAAWALPTIAALADQDERGGAELLPLLAECHGPIGPAMSLCLAYAMCARHEPDRIAATDAFLQLTAAPEPFATAVGADLADLAARDMVKLNRAVSALTDLHRAGATPAVWELLSTALPTLLPHPPRGLPDLLELATQTAAATGATGEIPGLSSLAARKGNTRLLTEARRLHAFLVR